MKRQVLILLTLLGACGEVQDGLEALNDAPLINFSDSQEVTVLRDSIKIGFDIKEDPIFYEVSLQVFDPNDNLREVAYNQLFGRGLLIQNDDTIRGNDIVVDSENLQFLYYPIDLGFHKFQVTATDNFEATSSIIIELEAFENLGPVAAYTFARDGQFGRRHWVFDASESFDRDERFGGRISAYEFRNGLGKIDVVYVPMEEVETNYEPWIYNVIFPEDNVYTVGLRVRDSDGQWSQVVTKAVSVE